MMLLSNVLEKYGKSITIELNKNDINSALIDLLLNVVQKQSGTCALKIKILNQEEKTLELFSNKFRVNIVDFIQEIRNFDINVSVN
jgi:hypothetical protein